MTNNLITVEELNMLDELLTLAVGLRSCPAYSISDLSENIAQLAESLKYGDIVSLRASTREKIYRQVLAARQEELAS